MHLKLGENVRKIIHRWGKGRKKLDYRIVKIMCSLQGGYGFFERCLTSMHRNNGQGLLKAQTTFYLNPNLPSWEFMIRSPCEVTFIELLCFVHNPFLGRSWELPAALFPTSWKELIWDNIGDMKINIDRQDAKRELYKSWRSWSGCPEA